MQGLAPEEQGDWVSERYGKIIVRAEVNLSKESWGGRGVALVWEEGALEWQRPWERTTWEVILDTESVWRSF